MVPPSATAHGVRRIATMDSDDEMMAQLFMQEEANATTERQQQLPMLTNLPNVPDSDCFAGDATHTPKDFRRRFRMNKDFFMKIVSGVREYDTYFICKKDCTGLWGVSSVQKCTTSMCCLAYEAPLDAVNNYMPMAESTCLERVYKFCRVVVVVFGPYYSRAPNADDSTRILAQNAATGFPRMLGIVYRLHALG
jgi:hypothetical protein